MKYLIISIFVIISSVSCTRKTILKDKKNENIVLIFNNALKKLMYEFPSGVRSGKEPMCLISFIDENNIRKEYSPLKKIDTLIIKNIKSEYLELFHKYQGLEDIFYLFRTGDTINFNYDSNKYPIAISTNYDSLTKLYNFQRGIRKRNRSLDFDSFTFLNHETFRILNKIKSEQPDVFNTVFKYRYKDFVDIDILKTQYAGYHQRYTNSLDSLSKIKSSSYIYYKYYKYYKYLLKRKDLLCEINDLYFSDKNKNNEVMEKKMLGFFNDSLVGNISYSLILNYTYLPYVAYEKQNVKLIKGINGGNYNQCQVFDNLNTDPNIPPATKRELMYLCLEKIIVNFPTDDIKEYLSKYKKTFKDTIGVNYLIAKYNLNFTTSNHLLLVDEYGVKSNFEDLLKKHKGKVIYVDFWASWCAPCRRSMPHAKALREEYKNKNIVFIYLAKNDKLDAWKRAIIKDKTNHLAENYLIENSIVSKMITDLNISSIPRYLIYDKTGKLVHKNAPGSSSDEIRNLLDNYISQD